MSATVQQVQRMSPWQIKSFPDDLREEVTAAARAKGVTVADFMARAVLALKEAGWMDGAGWPAKAPALPAGADPSQPDNLSKILRIVGALQTLKEAGVDPSPKLAGAVQAGLRAEMMMIRATQPEPVKRLSAPGKPAPEATSEAEADDQVTGLPPRVTEAAD